MTEIDRNLILGDKVSCEQHLKSNYMKGNFCTCVKKNNWLLLKRWFISDHPRNDIHFILPVMKNNDNRISFMVWWSFTSGSGFMQTHSNHITFYICDYVTIQQWPPCFGDSCNFKKNIRATLTGSTQSINNCLS